MTSNSKETLSSDDKYYEVFDTLESLEEQRIALTTAMKEGFMCMTSARFEYGEDATATFHIPKDREQEALSKIKLQPSSSSKTTSTKNTTTTFHLVNHNQESIHAEKEKNDDDETDEEKGRPSLLDYETEKQMQKKDPALWFGVKPYRYMSSAKTNFEKALAIAVEMCNLQQKMEQTIAKL
eukprot:gb/GECH01008650.1/.p1 GENE.gb/GECH01008650.1/~~gb/GECH01008650.1/.p1  ORF type:complete len:181 (+),score=57.50 gb/GECH01008650.1/:1-543(+)